MRGTEPLTVVLTASEWNSIMMLMGKQPFEVCADLILSIRDQCLQQQQSMGAPTAKPNGAAELEHAPH